MARAVENPKKFIISCRVDDDEMIILKKRARKSGLSITQLLRECLDLAEVEALRQNHACG